MNPFAMQSHLTDRHDVDWADDLDATEANRVHADLHSREVPGHDHEWAGIVADPQPQMRSDGGKGDGPQG